MKYVEKCKWPSIDVTTHEYKSITEALKNMDENVHLSIVSSELFDENDKLIATYKIGEGIKW